MSIYPLHSQIGWKSPEGMQLQFKTLISQFDDQGKEKRRRKWLYQKRLVSVQYDFISQDESRTLWQFYIARSGSFNAFSFYGKDPDIYVGEYVATGNGSDVLYSLPSKEAVDYTIYKDGDTLTEGPDYAFFSSLGASAGADSSDKIIMDIAPTDGARVTYDFNGTLRIAVRFKEDFGDYNTFQRKLQSSGVQMQGLLIDEL